MSEDSWTVIRRNRHRRVREYEVDFRATDKGGDERKKLQWYDREEVEGDREVIALSQEEGSRSNKAVGGVQGPRDKWEMGLNIGWDNRRREYKRAKITGAESRAEVEKHIAGEHESSTQRRGRRRCISGKRGTAVYVNEEEATWRGS